MPMTLATHPSESALACLVMVATYYGLPAKLTDLRQSFQTPSGLSIVGLTKAADRLGLEARSIRSDMTQLGLVTLPALVELYQGHWVVLKHLTRHAALVHDPLFGVRTIDRDQCDGVAIVEVKPALAVAKLTKADRTGFTQLWSHSEGVRSAFLQILLLSTAFQIVAFAAPLQMQLVIDEGIQRGDSDFLLLIAIGFGFAAVIQHLLEAIRSWTLQVVTQSLSFQVTINVVRHLLRLPYDFFEKRHLGDILSRLGSARAIQEIITRGLVGALLDGIIGLFALFILLYYSANMTIVVVISIVIIGLINSVSFGTLRRQSEIELSQRAREQSQLIETVRSVMTIKLMGAENERVSVWKALLADTTNTSISFGRSNILVSLARGIVASVQAVVVICIGARTVSEGNGFSIGMLVAYLSFRTTFTDRMLSLVNQVQQFRFIGLHTDRLSDIVDAEPEPSSQEPIEVLGRLQCKNVSFSYDAGETWVLRDVDLLVNPGDYIAITGPSGGGKTTLLKILLGLRKPGVGEVVIEDRLAKSEIWPSWRRAVGVVSQEDRLLSGTVAENIAFFDPDMDLQRVQEAAATAQVAPDINRMPHGYATMVGDMGAALSSGQKQRVLLARALYRQPAILILDEGTANIDIQSENEIARLIREMSLTRIVVAHRPALVDLADHVFNLDNGHLKRVR